ncbi:phenylacetate--CoA ligase family protein [Planctomycetota bacterium]
MNNAGKNTMEQFHPASAPDYLPTAQLRQLQFSRLSAMVKWAFEKVRVFRARMDERQMTPDDLKSLDDVARLPFTVKNDLRDTYPFGLFAGDFSQIVRLHASSGTTGKPIVVAYTQQDMDVWTSLMVRTFAACGVNMNDVVQNSYGYGLFTGGLGFHYGAEALGAAVIPTSGGNTERQIMIMKDFGTTVICCTPSYFVHIIERAGQMGIDLKQLPLRAGFFGAEPWTNEMRRHIEKESGIKAFDCYGLSEIIGPGVGAECIAQAGLHIFEDYFYAEIIDPETGEPLPDGTEGELVLTTLSKWAMPMIRYRTRDITRIITEPCVCGRTVRRIEKIGRRSDDMFIIRGVNVFPSQIETALMRVEGTLPHYQIILTRSKGLDRMEVQFETTSEALDEKPPSPEELQSKIAYNLEHILGIRAQVTLVEPNTIPRSEGKAKRLIDKRNI